jgi:hypothetical protein
MYLSFLFFDRANTPITANVNHSVSEQQISLVDRLTISYWRDHTARNKLSEAMQQAQNLNTNNNNNNNNSRTTMNINRPQQPPLASSSSSAHKQHPSQPPVGYSPMKQTTGGGGSLYNNQSKK